MIKKFPFPNYIYVSSKPIKNQGDTSIDSDSFKEIDEGISTIKDSLINKNKFYIPRENKKPIKKNIKTNKKIYSKKNLKLTPQSSTKYTEKRSSIKIEEESHFNIQINNHKQKENNRYNNCYEKEIKNNLRFLSCLKDEESDYNEGIIDNEISVNFVNGFNSKYKNRKDKQVEIPLDNIDFSRINTNSEISNDNMNRLIFSKTNKISIQSIMKEKNEKNIITNLDNNKDFLEDKENYTPNKRNDQEININLIEINNNKNVNNIILLDSNKIIKNQTTIKNNNKYYENRKSQISLGNRIKSNQRNQIFNLTKKYKIFHKFLTIGIDTSGLYTLGDDMKNFILNPKITYNYPFNNLEKELE